MRTLPLLLAASNGEPVTLTMAGAIMMIGCVTLVLGLNIFCLLRILRPSRPSEHHQGPWEVDTRDVDT